MLADALKVGVIVFLAAILQVSVFSSVDILRGTPDLLLVDLDLERLDGLLTLEIVRAISEDLPVVLISAAVSATIQQKARHLGAVAVLRKPFRNSELLDVLARACRAEDGAKGASG